VDHLAYFLEPARSHRLYLSAGRVALEAQFASGRKASRTVTSSAGETTRIELREPAALAQVSVPHAAPQSSPAPEAAERAPKAPSKGVPVIIPWLTGAAAVACGAATVWAAVDTKRLHDDYVQHPTDEKWNAGIARQKMTNAFLASTAVLAATTVTLTFFVHGSEKTNVALSPTLGPTAASVDLTGRF
jgi:hypothetical protein